VLADDGTLWLNLGDSYRSNPGVADIGVGSPNSTVGNAKSGCQRRSAPAGYKPKDLLGIPWRVALALQADGWYLRSDIIWAKPNPMPESVRDRPTKAHEYVFLLSKHPRYFYDADAVREPHAREYAPGYGSGKQYRNGGIDHLTGANRNGSSQDGLATNPPNPSGRNVRTVWRDHDPDQVAAILDAMTAHFGEEATDAFLASLADVWPDVWTITPRPFKGAHFATFPPELAERCIKAGSSERGKCPECGAAWVRVVEVERWSERERKRGTARGWQGLPGRNTEGGQNGLHNMNGQTSGRTATTTGWRPTCDHGHEPVPDVVLDPFAGAGTVGLVCQRLGRSHIGAELNPQYRDMALARIKAESSPLLESAA
jgi:DNA modification methylase